jgi:hydroxyethylthiazole kinase-like uncharacterized protein yjeF
MQAAERQSGVPVPQLMENAGLAVAQEAWLFLGELADRRILILAGPGNNGGDGLVAARHLKDWGADVILFLLKPRAADDANFAQITERQVPVILADEDANADYKRLADALAAAELVIDALLGTGRGRPIEGPLADVLDRLKAARESRLPPRLLAVDLPTGLDADSGAADPHTIAADATVALGWSKVGLHVLPGAQYAGRVEVVDIGIPPECGAAIQTELLTHRWAKDQLPARPPDAHKGTFGSALVIGGSPSYVGAPCLAATSAMRVGAGLVTVACGRSIYPIVAAKLTEATFEPLEDKDGQLSAQEASSIRRALERGYQAVLAGPGLGQGGYVQAFMRALLPILTDERLHAVVIDADGLNNLAKVDRWWDTLPLPAIITPHPGEMSRLTGLPVPEIQAGRLAVARKYAAEWQLVVLLKGAPSIIAAPDGRVRINPFTNPAFASAGTGDVLAGAITGFVAQGVEPFEAACLGLFISSQAGEHLRREMGTAGAIATDQLPLLPRVIKELRGE